MKKKNPSAKKRKAVIAKNTKRSNRLKKTQSAKAERRAERNRLIDTERRKIREFLENLKPSGTAQ